MVQLRRGLAPPLLVIMTFVVILQDIQCLVLFLILSAGLTLHIANLCCDHPS